jgi:hypothetical protein
VPAKTQESRRDDATGSKKAASTQKDRMLFATRTIRYGVGSDGGSDVLRTRPSRTWQSGARCTTFGQIHNETR